MTEGLPHGASQSAPLPARDLWRWLMVGTEKTIVSGAGVGLVLGYVMFYAVN